MKVLIQKVKYAEVKVEGKIVGKINKGLLVFLGVSHNDNEIITDKLVKKLINLRIFEDENNKMNKTLKDVNGELLIVSQFTLYADCSHGNRPSFTEACEQTRANELYEYFKSKCSEYNVKVESGIFGADMKVELLNDGPVTIMLDDSVVK